MVASRAAVAHAAGQPLSIETVNVDGPREGEVMVEIKATGICHTDAFTLSGDDHEGLFPAILGHEGAGIVVETGPGVHSVSTGDHVIPLYTPECRVCDYCTSGKTNLCQSVRETQGRGLMPDEAAVFPLVMTPCFITWAHRLSPILRFCLKLPWPKSARTLRSTRSVTSVAG